MGIWEDAHFLQHQTVVRATAELIEATLRHPNITTSQLGIVYEAVVQKYGEVAAVIALQSLENSRRAAGSWDVLPRPTLADEPPIEQVRGTFAWAVNTATSKQPLDLAKRLAGPLGRLVQQRARDTVVKATEEAHTRYARLPGPKACAFCLMLASRGAVYSKRTASAVGIDQGGKKRSKRPEGEAYHDNCDCIAIESLHPSDLPQVIEELGQEWAQATGRPDGQAEAGQWKLWKKHVAATRPNHETRSPLRGEEKWVPYNAKGVFERPKKNRERYRVITAQEALDLRLDQMPSTKGPINKRDRTRWKNERAMVDWFKSQGSRATMLGTLDEALSGKNDFEGIINTPDFIVDGETVEVKTLSKPKRMSDHARTGVKQSHKLVYDLRNSDADEKEIESELKHTVRNYGDRAKMILVITKDRPMVWRADQ